ncbi:MAG: hypothetical protein WBQ03_23270 [Candidatus Sulfotelmatobacter sp.]
MSQVRQAFAGVSADDLRDMINEAVASARKDKRRQPKRRLRRKQ